MSTFASWTWSFVCAAALVAATAAPGQSPLVTLRGGTNQGNTGGGVYFDLTIHSIVSITAIEFATGSNTIAGTGGLEVWLGPTTYSGNVGNPATWSRVATAANVAVGPSAVSFATLVPPIGLGPGDYGVALRAIDFSHGYTNGIGCWSTTVPGGCSNATFHTAEMTLRAGAASNAFLTPPMFTPRVFNGSIHYVNFGFPIPLARWQPYGTGCYGWYQSFYEWFSNPSLDYDLGNGGGGTNSLVMDLHGNGYLVNPFRSGTGTFHTPTAAAIDLLLVDDSVAPVLLPWSFPYPTRTGVRTTTRLEVCSNGFVSPDGSNGASGVPSVAALLGGQPRWGNWFDFAPGIQGRVSYEVDPNGQRVYVTWENVGDRGPGTNTWQIAFDRSGAVEFRWRAMSSGGGGSRPALVGWTPGGGALDPGSIDLTSCGWFQTGPDENAPLQLRLATRPRLGSNLELVTDAIPAGTPIGGVLLGPVGFDPGLPLAALRMPGCFQYVDSGVASALLFTPVGPTGTVMLPIPVNTSLERTVFFAQSVAFTGGYNAFGAVASQGVRMVLGSL